MSQRHKPSPYLIRRILNWENKTASGTALLGYMLVIWCFQLWMLPCALVLVFVRNIISVSLAGGWKSRGSEEEQMEAVEVSATEEDTENKAGTLAQMQEIVLKVQV